MEEATLSKALMQRMSIGKVFKPLAATSAPSQLDLEAPITSLDEGGEPQEERSRPQQKPASRRRSPTSLVACGVPQA